MENQEIVEVMEAVKDALVAIAQNVYNAHADDGKISFSEATALTTSSLFHAVQVVTAFRHISKASVRELLDALANSDITFSS